MKRKTGFVDQAGTFEGLMYRHYSEGQSLLKDWLYYTDEVLGDE